MRKKVETSKNNKRECDWSCRCKLIRLPKWCCEQLGEISWMIKKKSIIWFLKWNCEWPRKNQLGWLPKWDCEQLGGKKWTIRESQHLWLPKQDHKWSKKKSVNNSKEKTLQEIKL